MTGKAEGSSVHACVPTWPALALLCVCMVIGLHILKTNWPELPTGLFITWTTVILVKLNEFLFRWNNDWFRCNNESIGPTMIIGKNYEIIS